MRRWRETVEVCLGVTGLRGAFSHGVVSDVRRVLRQLWLTVIALPRRASETHNHECTCVCVSANVFWCLLGQKMDSFLYQLHWQESFKIQELL